MAKLQIPSSALAAQTRAADPRASVWVSANAGSGKTHVLTERVIRLLLNGAPPARILCLTYTKAAAAVMQTRIFDRLARWTALSDEELAAELTAMEGVRPDTVKLAQARRLFAEALETPGGLKIQTIHAFCESLLHQFPLEANIPGHFELMDDAAQNQRIAEAKQQMLTDIYNNPNSPLGEAFSLILARAGEFSLDKLLAEAIQRKQELAPYAANLAADNGAELNNILGLSELTAAAAADNKSIEAHIADGLRRKVFFSEIELARMEILGGKKAAEFTAKLKQAKKQANSQEMLNILTAAYCSKGEIRKISLFGKKLLADWPELEELFSLKAAAVLAAAETLKAAALKDMNQAAYTLIADLLKRYAALKQAQGLMDFSDLISRSLALLKRRGAGQWVQYKLDKGIDHILVDEAQDTAPEQWEIIRLLSQDFFAGLSAREDLTRTIFAVGDEKQSIYSFQGANPQDFSENGRYQARRAMHAEKLFRRESLAFSFRSTPDVLQAVDGVFSLPQNYKGLSAENEPTVHDAIRIHDQGYVEYWQAFSGEEQAEPDDWTESAAPPADPAALLAQSIVRTIAHWLDSGEILAGRGRPIAPGDIMILERKRDSFIHILSRELKSADIPVAGADRLKLTDHIAVQDLMALGNFVLQPRDDLSLAALLKSPLFGISEEQLLDIAAGRKGTLWEALLDKAEKTDLIECCQKLQSWRNFFDIKPVYEFYSKILAEDGGRRRFLARLGAEAADILDAFLDYCLAAQKTGLPGLQVFLHDLSENSPEIKRELDQSRGEVRIMTVHASKGQEAPIVFLADGGGAIWHSSHAPCLLPYPVSEEARRADQSLPPQIRLWLPKADYKTREISAILDRLKMQAEEEYHRLLYVGMTRAEDRLIVCGRHKAREPQDTWLPVVSAALADKAKPVKAVSDDIIAHRFQPSEASDNAAAVPRETKPQISLSETVPAFLLREPPAEPPLPRPLAPSGASGIIESEPETNPELMLQSPILPEAATDGQDEQSEKFSREILTAAEKGTLIHALLQYLPAIPAYRRRGLAQAYLTARLGEESSPAIAEIMDTLFAVLEDKRLAMLFGADGRSEAALMGLVPVKGVMRAISGQIDRLAINSGRIIFADYKTGKPPEAEKDIPPIYKMQLALYAALLRAIYPERSIEAWLIYTQSMRVFRFENDALAPLLE